MSQPGKVANPARGQLNRENEHSPVPLPSSLARPNFQARTGTDRGMFIFPFQLTITTGEWKTMALKAEVWVEAVTEDGRRFMAAWRKEEEEDAARHRQEKREATRLGRLQSHTEA